MKLLCTSLAALAIASAAPAAAQNAAPAAATADAAYPMTPQGAADWVAMVENEMGDFGVEYARVSWVNSTYITPDTDALAAKYGAQATEMSVRYAMKRRNTRRYRASTPTWRASSISCATAS